MAVQSATPAPDDAFDRLKQIAQLRGFAYLPAAQVAQLPVEQICARVGQATAHPLSMPAVLGAVEPPKLTTKNWLETYQDHISEKLATHSDDQKHRCHATRVRAVKRFVSSVGEKVVQDITRQDVLAFRQWWRKNMEKKGLKPNTANKDFKYLSAMWNALARLEGWAENNPFTGMTFTETESLSFAFSESWIENHLLKPGDLDGLNDQARDILRIMVNTGARPSELVNLTAEHICLSHNLPHIQIRADGRRLKTRYSERNLPLVGCALDAMRRHPEGFPRYRHKAAHWSNLTTKYLRLNDLLETPQHTPYSLRHAISDRLQNAGCEDRTRKEIMGHRPEGIIYGSGATLETKAAWLEKVVLPELDFVSHKDYTKKVNF